MPEQAGLLMKTGHNLVSKTSSVAEGRQIADHIWSSTAVSSDEWLAPGAQPQPPWQSLRI